MKRIILLLTLATGLTVAANAQTSKGTWLVSGATNVGFSAVNTKYSNGGISVDGEKVSSFNISSSVGYFVVENLSVGLSLDFTNSSTTDNVDKISASTFTILPTATYFFTKNTSVKPFLGAGVGYASYQQKFNSVAQTNGGLAWEVDGGLAYFINPKIGINLGLGYGQISIEDSGITTKLNTFGAKVGFSLFL